MRGMTKGLAYSILSDLQRVPEISEDEKQAFPHIYIQCPFSQGLNWADSVC